MKNTALKVLFLLNYILLILYVSRQTNSGQAGIESITPLLISSLMLIDITYISSCNIRSNKTISLFCGLLALDSWYILLSFERGVADFFLFAALSPVIWYISIRFILMFLFQGSGYRFRKTVNAILLITCIVSLAGIAISDRVYALFYGLQFLISLLCFIFILIYHRKRIAFIMKSEWKCILFSFCVIGTAFLCYYAATRNIKNHISNFGIYLPMLLFFMSVHGVVLKQHQGCPLSTIFHKRQTILIICLSMLTLGLINLFTGSGYNELFIAVNGLSAFIYMCNIILGENLKRGTNKLIKESKYVEALRQLQQEELLKAEFANFLHDDILQDLLSVKNMMTKAYRPDIQDIIIETLDDLNKHVRKQMQDYHPVILKNLTAKENYQNLIDAVSQTFPQRSITIFFDCSSSLFLVEPYNMLVYRLLKELLSNVYKHSDGNSAWITLTQEKGIIELNVSDNGNANSDTLNSADKQKHKGFASITEQVNRIKGTIQVSDNIPHGISVQITIPMEGDVSYQYFVS